MKRKINRSVEIVIDATIYLGGVGIGEYYTQPSVFKKAWESSQRMLNEMFGGVMEYISPTGISCPPLSYGHLGCIGAKIRYPENSDPNMTQMVDSVGEGIKWLKRSWDFSKSDIFKLYDAYHQKIQEDFPDKKIPFGGLGKEGPITSAVLMRGQDFYVDMYENPEESKEFLRLLTDSIIEFEKFTRRINNITATDNMGVGIADDFAGFLAPSMLDEFVVPYWNRLYEGLTVTGPRSLHCEGMSRAHLPCLAKCGISYFQPSVSPLLTCSMLAKDLDIAYDWLLPSFELANMDSVQIEKWVDDTVATGVHLIRTQAGRYLLQNYAAEVGRYLLQNRGTEKIYSYLDAFKKYD